MNGDRNKEKRMKKTDKDKDKENKMLEETAHKV